MEQRNYMRKRSQKLTRISTDKNDGFNNLIDAHTQALENNSLKIIKALEALSDKQLKPSEREALNKVKTRLRKIDKGLDDL